MKERDLLFCVCPATNLFSVIVFNTSEEASKELKSHGYLPYLQSGRALMKDLYIISEFSEANETIKLSSNNRILVQLKKFEVGCFHVEIDGDINLLFKVNVDRSALGISDFCNLHKDHFLILTYEGNLNYYMFEGRGSPEIATNALGENYYVVSKDQTVSNTLNFFHEYFFDYHRYRCRYTSIRTFSEESDTFLVTGKEESFMNMDKRIILMRLNRKEAVIEKLDSLDFDIQSPREPLYCDLKGYCDVLLLKNFGIFDKILKIRRDCRQEMLSVYMIKEGRIVHLEDLRQIGGRFRIFGMEKNDDFVWIYNRDGQSKTLNLAY